MPGRKFNSNSYKYGYQGSEKDDEILGEGNAITTHYRGLDTRLGRWWSTDPKEDEMPWQSPYVSMDDNPVLNNDPNGDCIPCFTALIYGGVELGGQLIANGGDFSDVDWVDVGAETVKGALAGTGVGLIAGEALDVVKAGADWKANGKGPQTVLNGGKSTKAALIDYAVDQVGGVVIDKAAKLAKKPLLKAANASKLATKVAISTEKNATKLANKQLRPTSKNLVKQVERKQAVKTAQANTYKAAKKEAIYTAASKQANHKSTDVVNEAVENKVSEETKKTVGTEDPVLIKGKF